MGAVWDSTCAPGRQRGVALRSPTAGCSAAATVDADHDDVGLAEEAARVLGRDLGGIGFLTPDICQPVRETGGAIVEVNRAPGARMHTHPTERERQNVTKAVIDMV